MKNKDLIKMKIYIIEMFRDDLEILEGRYKKFTEVNFTELLEEVYGDIQRALDTLYDDFKQEKGN